MHGWECTNYYDVIKFVCHMTCHSQLELGIENLTVVVAVAVAFHTAVNIDLLSQVKISGKTKAGKKNS